MPWNPPKSNDIVNPQPTSKATELQTPARRPAPSRSVPGFTKPRVSLGKAVSSKPVPKVTTSRVPPWPATRPTSAPVRARARPATSRVATGLTVTPVRASRVAMKTSSPPQKADYSEAEVPRVPPSRTVPATVTRPASMRRQSRIPVTNKRSRMPGTFPGSDVEE